MDATSVQRETITRKALRLYPERTVEPLGHGRYCVEGSAADYYEVDLGLYEDVEESCNCPATSACYHTGLATIYRAKARMAARRAQASRTAARTSRGSLAPLVAS